MMSAIDLLSRARAFLLDFDGPIAALMPSPANELAAREARRPLMGVDLPLEIESASDHLAVLRWARLNADDATSLAVEAACTEVEIDAAGKCDPSPTGARLFELASELDIPIAVVSNNSTLSVHVFLDRVGWLDQVDVLACRTPETVDLIKPSPHLLRIAADALRIPIEDTVFVGDSVSDVIASKAAGCPVLGLAKNERRRMELVGGGADQVISLNAAAF
ncbi:HAD family hydrolase [Nocardioides cavernaquae]|nr:HAD family hydrolase [Nocardioides cavernaquae]